MPSRNVVKPASTRRRRVDARSRRTSGELPAVDERLVAPETRYEIHEGRLVYVAPSDEPHGSRHAKISILLEAYAARGFAVAVDMLTRTSATSDMAPDASVYPRARDPETGGRQIEQLAFEVASTERLSHAGKKAAALAARGVRRVFAIDVKRRRVLEWSTRGGTWDILPVDGAIADPALALPLPTAAIVDAASAEDAIATALMAKGNPVIERAVSARYDEGKAEGKAEGRVEGNAEGTAKAVLVVLRGRGIKVSSANARRILETRDHHQLDEWLRRAVTCTDIDELFLGR